MNLSSILGNKAKPYGIEHNGTFYPVSMLTQGKKAEFERELKARAMETLKQEQEFFPPEIWQAGLREFREHATQGLYSFHGPLAEKVLESPAGSLMISRILFGLPEEKMLEIWCDKQDEVRLLLDLVLAESSPRRKPEYVDSPDKLPGAQGAEGGDPNAQKPAV